MKMIKRLLFFALFIVVVITVIGVIGYKKVHVEMNEDDLPQNVYEEDADLLSVVNAKLIDLFVLSSGNEYTVVEEVVNLIILDTIRENVNASYDPLGTCDTDECNFIMQDDIYYVSHAWAELTANNQLMVRVSIGSDRLFHVNTIIDFYMDVDINYTAFGITLTLDELQVNDMGISKNMLDKLLANFDLEKIEEDITEGELDMEAYKYTLSFSVLP